MISVKGIQGISLIDYPNKIVSTLFLAGCNFRCPFCHNPELIEENNDVPVIKYDELMKKLKDRINFIDGICITGGEPLMKDEIVEFIKDLKRELMLPIKIDTNGYNPKILKQIIEMDIVDYIAMDIKTSLNKYYIAAGINIKTDMIKESIELIINSDIDSEFRTTCVPDIVDSSDIREIGSYIVGAKKFALQQFRKEKTLNEEFSNKHPYKPEEIVKFKDILKQFIDNIVIRGL